MKILNLFLIHKIKILKNFLNLLILFFKKNSNKESTPELNKKIKQEPQSESINFGLFAVQKSPEKKMEVEQQLDQNQSKDSKNNSSLNDKSNNEKFQFDVNETEDPINKYKRNSNYVDQDNIRSGNNSKSKLDQKQDNFEQQNQNQIQKQRFSYKQYFDSNENSDQKPKRRSKNIQDINEQFQREKNLLREEPKNQIVKKLSEFRKSLKPQMDLNLDINDPESQLQANMRPQKQQKQSREDHILNILKTNNNSEVSNKRNNSIKNPVLPQNVMIYGNDDSNDSEQYQKNLENPQKEDRQQKMIQMLNKNQNLSIFDQKEIEKDDDLLADFQDSNDDILLKQIPDSKNESKQKKLIVNPYDQDIQDLNNSQQTKKEALESISLLANNHLISQQNNQNKEKISQQNQQLDSNKLQIQKTIENNKNSLTKNSFNDNQHKIQDQAKINQNQQNINSENNFNDKQDSKNQTNSYFKPSQKSKEKLEIFRASQRSKERQSKSIKLENTVQFGSAQKRFKRKNKTENFSYQFGYSTEDNSIKSQQDDSKQKQKNDLNDLIQNINTAIKNHDFSLIGDKEEKKLLLKTLKFKNLKKIVLKKYLLREKILKKKNFYNKIQQILDQKIEHLKFKQVTQKQEQQNYIYKKSNYEKLLKKFFHLKLLRAKIFMRSQKQEYTFIYKSRLMIFCQKKSTSPYVMKVETFLESKFDFFKYTENSVEDSKRKFTEIIMKFFADRTKNQQQTMTTEYVLNQLCFIYTQFEQVIEQLTELLKQQKIKNLDFNRNGQFTFLVIPRRTPFISITFELNVNKNFKWTTLYKTNDLDKNLQGQFTQILKQNFEDLNDCLTKVFQIKEINIGEKFAIILKKLHQQFSFNKNEENLFEDSSSFYQDLKLSKDTDPLTFQQVIFQINQKLKEQYYGQQKLQFWNGEQKINYA